MMEAKGSEVFARSPKLAFRRIGESFVLVSILDNRILRLNDTGSEIWGRLDGRRDLEAIAAEICVAFDVPADRALADVIEFMDLLVSRGFAVRC
jgi:hypothetical protein